MQMAYAISLNTLLVVGVYVYLAFFYIFLRCRLSFHLHDVVNSFGVAIHLIMTQTCVKYDYVAWRFSRIFFLFCNKCNASGHLTMMTSHRNSINGSKIARDSLNDEPPRHLIYFLCQHRMCVYKRAHAHKRQEQTACDSLALCFLI